jgi:hypothetical protein
MHCFHRVRLTSFLLLCALLSHAADAEMGVSFSAQGGFYDSPFYLTLSCPHGLTIHYTLNGNEPTRLDKVYEHPLFLDEKLYSKSNIYTVQTCPDSIWFVPNAIKKCIVIRAAAFNENGNCIGSVTTNSYFIKSLETYSTNLPIVSLCADSLALFGYEEGILLQEGAHKNCFQHGRDWERLCNFEFYEIDNQGINQQAGLRTHGNITREGIQKGLKLYARSEYSQKRFKYKFFETTDHQSFKHLVLKPMKGGAIRDLICTQIANSLNFENPQSRPVILFLNGEYWGLYYLKEKPDAQFIADQFGMNKENIDIIESWSGTIADGDNQDFIKMMQWFMKSDLTNDNEYQRACSLIDVDCFIDYYCFQLFTANGDWPSNNMRCWQADNGKWRWIFFDGDECLNSYPNMLANTIINKENTDISTLVFSKLLNNEDFRDRFYARFGHLLTNEFHPKHTKEYYYSCAKSVENEIDAQFSRFGYQNLKDKYEFQLRFTEIFLSYRMVSAASMVYRLYFYNGWTFNNSATSSQKQFKYNPDSRRPTFLLRMARQFKDWKYVRMYFAYERSRIHNEMKTSKLRQSMKHSRIWRKLNGKS